MPRLVENPSDRLPADNVVAHSLARLGAKGEKGYFQLITENNDTPKQVTDIIKGVTNIVLKVQPSPLLAGSCLYLLIASRYLIRCTFARIQCALLCPQRPKLYIC